MSSIHTHIHDVPVNSCIKSIQEHSLGGECHIKTQADIFIIAPNDKCRYCSNI